MRIAIIGTGYVGLVSGACLADFGHDIVCIDKNKDKIRNLQQGRVPIYEPGLSDIMDANIKAGRLSFSTDCSAVRDAGVVFIAVGTPASSNGGHADLSFVYSAARDVAAHLGGFTVVVTKSTVPVGTGDEVERIIREARPDADFEVAANPEFLREGAAIRDFKLPDRIVVGAENERARNVLSEVYRPLYLNAAPLLFTSRRTAELIKYAANAFLATKITFINEIADLCEKVGADVQEVARGMGLDNRIGTKFLHAGPGFGGSCFPKDTTALVTIGQDHEAPLRIVEAVVAVNDQRKRAMARKVVSVLGGHVRGKTIAMLGLTFKPNTDDIREAPSLVLSRTLMEMGARIRVFDPAGMENAKAALNGAMHAESAYDCAQGADALVIVTEWEQFRALDLARLRRMMHQPIMVDLRNVYRQDEAERHGFTYVGIGKGSG